jgi:hypothetical protein
MKTPSSIQISDLIAHALFLGSHNNLKRKVLQTGRKIIPYKMFNNAFIIALNISVIWTAAFFIARRSYFVWDFTTIAFIIPLFFVISTAFIIIATAVGLRLYLEALAFSRTNSIQNNLPTFLREFSSNLRAGREFVDALEDANSPQYGPLFDDIKGLVVSIRSGIIMTKVLEDYSKIYDSYIIQETFDVIKDAYNGGGGLAEIIDRIADNLGVIHYLRKKAIASVSNYIMFMTIVALIIAPLLFGLAYHLLSLIQSLLERVVSTGASQFTPTFVRSLRINFTHFTIFSYIGLGIIAGSAAAITGIVKTGTAKGSIVLVLMYIGIAFVAYNISYWLIDIFFKSLLLV